MAWAMLTLWDPGTSADAAPQAPGTASVAVASWDPEPRPAAEPEGADLRGRPWATLSLEPTPTSPPEALTTPVVEPAGYLLPAESGEETFHAGG
jgi:hypothetical protein